MGENRLPCMGTQNSPFSLHGTGKEAREPRAGGGSCLFPDSSWWPFIERPAGALPRLWERVPANFKEMEWLYP